MRHAPWPGAPRRLARTDPVLEAAHASRVERSWWAALWLLAALGFAWLLAGCAGGGPLGTGLGEVVASIKVTDPSGKTCQVDVANGKDQTNLALTDLSVCGGHLGSLHADRSDGAQAAIAANAAVANHAIDVGAGLAGDALTALGVPHGSPKPVPGPVPTPKPAPVPAPLPPPFPKALESTEP